MYGTQCNDIISNSFFLPFSVNCSQVAMFQIMPALCPHGQGEGVVNLMWTDLGRRRRGSQKSPNPQISFTDDPYLQKQLLVGVFQSRFSEKSHNIHRKTAVSESLFHKVAGLKTSSVIEKRPQHRSNLRKF